MCKSIKLILLSALFVLLLAGPLSSQSAKEQIIAQLSECQVKLETVSQSIETYKINIASLKSQIANLSQQLTDSINDCETLKRQLETCKQLLMDSQADLTKQEQIYETLSIDLAKLKTSLTLYRNSTRILGTACIFMGGYIGGHLAKWW